MNFLTGSNSIIANRYSVWRKRYIRDEPNLNSNSDLPCRYVFYNGTGENGDAVTCSEAMGYGMLISVLMNARDDFDALLRYVDYFRNNRGLLGWQQRRDPNTGRLVPGKEGGENSATDGDLDCIAALWMAGKRWNTTQYTQSARNWSNAFLKYCIHPTTNAMLVGDWAHPDFLTTGRGSRSNKKQLAKRLGKVRSFLRRLGFKTTDESDAQWLTRPSDFIMAHLVLFSKKHTEKSEEWTRVTSMTRSILNSQYKLNPNTGLVADFLVWNPRREMYLPAKGEVLESTNDGDYNWNACRVPWRLGHYYLTSGDDAVESHMKALAHFFVTKCHDGEVYAGYKLNGTKLVDYTDLAFLAPAAYCLDIMDNPAASTFRRRMEEAFSDATYYGETIAMLTLLQTSGNSLELLN
ncbi:Six-hairpin glycosidase-like protein [Syncephalis plumigaleata]|nr:Six-hairpin glycosidase-like protein [Syncephalis plumigaleata]